MFGKSWTLSTKFVFQRHFNFCNMTLVVTPKNKKEEKIIKAFMQSHQINFHSEEEEDAALHSAMQHGRKTPLANEKEKEAFLAKLNSTK